MTTMDLDMAGAPRAGESRETMIALKGVTKSFGAHSVLAGVDLEITRGESVVIIGMRLENWPPGSLKDDDRVLKKR